MESRSGGTITGQLKLLVLHRIGGASVLRWTRGLDAVRKVFVTLHKKGLIYKDKRLVNWDPALHTAISDLEVQQVESNGHL